MSRQRDELGLYLQIRGFVPEMPFRGLNGRRRFRWDWALDTRPAGPAIAVEYHGVVTGGVGGHQSIAGTWRDHEKANEGQLAGFVVIACNVRSVEDGRCYRWIDLALGEEAAS